MTAVASVITAGALPPLLAPVIRLIRSARVSERRKGRAEKLRTLIRNMSEGVIAFERNDELLLVNPAAQALLGAGSSSSGPSLGNLLLPTPLL